MGKKIKINIKSVIYLLNVDDILYCEAEEQGSAIHKADHSIDHIDANINDLERKLRAYYFWRTDAKHLVNLKCLEEVPSKSGELTLIDKSKIPIDKTRKKNLLEALNDLH